MSAGGTTGYTRDPAGALVGIRGTNRSYYLFDGLGSVVAVTSSSGSVTNSYTYDPFGVTTETKATLTNVFNPWRYTGQYQDTSTGLYKMGARYYQPELGRWTQQDPSGLDANAYAYVGGNPVNLIDPAGTAPCSGPFGNTFLGTDLTQACAAHDACYDTIGDRGAQRTACDILFSIVLQDLLRQSRLVSSGRRLRVRRVPQFGPRLLQRPHRHRFLLLLEQAKASTKLPLECG